jgi:lambda family phage portal protein
MGCLVHGGLPAGASMAGSMNVLDRAISFFAPGRALARQRARVALRVYDGAQPGRRAQSFSALRTSANAEIQMALAPLRDRARDLARNSPYAPRVLDIFSSHIVGMGLRPVPHTGKDKLDTKVSDMWEEFQRRADVEGVLSLYAQQGLAVRSTIESGEVVGRFIDLPLEKGREDRVPLKIQLLEADFIDHWREGIFGEGLRLGVTPDTKHSRLGVGLGDYDRRTGLWLFPWHPGEITTFTMRPGISRFVPRPELIHMYRVQRPGQVRGVSWFAPVLLTNQDLKDFLDALVVKARVEACFAGFIINSDSFNPIVDAAPQPTLPITDWANPSAGLTNLEPGMLKELKTGQDIKFAQPTSATQVAPILTNALMAMAVGTGLTYDQLTGDLRGANYSSLRAGKLDFRAIVEQLQQLMVIPMFCQPVWDRFISRAILAGELSERSNGYPCEWVAPAWAAVNPRYDLNSERDMVRAGRMSPQEFIAEYGGDWRRVLSQTKEFYDECDRLGIVLDIDPRRTTQVGQIQPGEVPPAIPKFDEHGNPIEADEDEGLLLQ